MSSHREGFRADVQGLRAIAVMFVLLYHADVPWMRGGFLGVDVFFVVSGFVIGRNLVREIDRSGTISLRNFYQRRIRRILPPLAVVLTFTTAGALLFQSPLGGASDTARTSLATSAFIANIKLAFNLHGYFDAAPTANPLLHMWSLSVEEQFYFFAPALLLLGLWIARRRSRPDSRRTLMPMLAAVGLASLVLCLAVSLTSVFASIERAQTFAFYGSPFRAWEFIAGLLLALLDDRFARIPRRLAQALGPVGLVLLGFGAVTYRSTTVWPGVATIVPVLATCAVIAGHRGSPSAGSARLLGSPAAVWVGDISYPLYLWHFPFVVFATNLWPGAGMRLKLTATAIAFLPAWLSDRYLEQPIVRRKRFRSTLAVFGLCLTVPVAASAANVALANDLRGQPRFTRLLDETAQHAQALHHCDESAITWDRARCTWPTPGAVGNVLLVGDSLSAALSEAAIDSGKALRLDVVIRPASGCPFLDVRIDQRGFPDTNRVCNERNARILTAIRADPPSTVVISFGAHYLSMESYRFVDGNGRMAATPTEKRIMMTRSLTRILGDLDRAGVPVVIVEPMAEFAAAGRLVDCPTIRIVESDTPCAVSMSRAAFDRQLADARSMLAEARPAPVTVSLEPLVCSANRCSTASGGVHLVGDRIHLTVQGSHRAAPAFTEAVGRALKRASR